MKNFDPINFDLKSCHAQLKKFRKLLNKAELDERKDILRFFKANKQLAALIGGRFPELIQQDRIAFEYELFGDFACDLVIGNSQTATYCFVEFEEGKPKSVFQKAGAKATLEWSSRFEHGLSQIVDWFWKLDDMRSTQEYSDRFGAALINIYGLLVIGRDEGLADREKQRLKWRLQKVIVDSHPVACITYDQLYNAMLNQFREYPSTQE